MVCFTLCPFTLLLAVMYTVPQLSVYSLAVSVNAYESDSSFMLCLYNEASPPFYLESHIDQFHWSTYLTPPI
jgi:hypothetical protein